MKIYAKQVPPEYQESPLFMGDWPENVFVYGNPHYNGHGGEIIEDIKSAMYSAADNLKWLMRGRLDCSFKDIIADTLPAPEHKKEYSRADRLEWRRLLLAYDAGAVNDDDALCAALELINGRAWENTTIRGCCQGDWQNVIYPAEYGRGWLEAFEAEYFNTGTEWIVDPDGDAFSVYVTGWRDDDARQEIADAYGCNPDDVVLLEFTGWSRSACYEEVTA